MLVVLVIVGVVLYVVNTLIPIDAKIKTLINIVVVLAVCLWLLQTFGIMHGGPVIRLR